MNYKRGMARRFAAEYGLAMRGLAMLGWAWHGRVNKIDKYPISEMVPNGHGKLLNLMRD